MVVTVIGIAIAIAIGIWIVIAVVVAVVAAKDEEKENLESHKDLWQSMSIPFGGTYTIANIFVFPCHNLVGVARFICCVASNSTFPEQCVNLRVSGV